MANIHRINDPVPNPNPNQRNNRPNPNDQEGGGGGFNNVFQDPSSYTPNVLATCEKHRVPFYSGAKRVKHPQEESFFDFFLINVCPVIKPLSFTVAICVIDIIIFIALLAVGGIDLSRSLLAVKAMTLYQFRGMFDISIYKGHVERLLCAIALHANFMHIFGNLLTTLIVLSRVEYTYGLIATIIMYFVSGIGGNIFSAVIQTNYSVISVGASTSLFGIIGLLVGYIIINYPALAFMGDRMRCNLIVMMVILVMFSILVTAGVQSVDNWGHLGGFLTGLWLSSAPSPIQTQRRQKIIRIVFAVLLVTQFLICFLVFYLGKPDLKIAAALSPY